MNTKYIHHIRPPSSFSLCPNTPKTVEQYRVGGKGWGRVVKSLLQCSLSIFIFTHTPKILRTVCYLAHFEVDIFVICLNRNKEYNVPHVVNKIKWLIVSVLITIIYFKFA
jgi:hypothetical protein